jgi:hypothetical protein
VRTIVSTDPDFSGLLLFRLNRFGETSFSSSGRERSSRDMASTTTLEFRRGDGVFLWSVMGGRMSLIVSAGTVSRMVFFKIDFRGCSFSAWRLSFDETWRGLAILLLCGPDLS